MKLPTRTPAGKWVIYSVSTGAALSRWPVDAQDMLRSGAYTADPPIDGAQPAATVDAVPQPALPKEHPLGVPLVVTQAHEAAPSAPVEIPRSSKGWKGRASR